MASKNKIRLYVDTPLASGATVSLPCSSSHYLCNVMRCTIGDELLCFNAKDGEFCCRINNIDKKQTSLDVLNLVRKSELQTDVWLLFAPLKKDQTDFVVQKAVELGVTRLIPILTEYSNTAKVRIDRFKAQATEASEQCGRLSIPSIDEPQHLKDILSTWANNRCLFFMDERRHGEDAPKAFSDCKDLPSAILIGPEGGFSEQEAMLLSKHPFVKNVCLGPRILRAETAAIAALAVFQAVAGDWKKE